MNFELLSAQEQVATLIRRIYARGITTASGGNLSIRDAHGDVWITPARIDKGKLQAADVVCVTAAGKVLGRHSPSTELPFHHAIYQKRADIHAIVHAHCPSLVSYSIARKVPQTLISATASQVCGPVGYAPYAVTQSVELGRLIADGFEDGVNAVLMENHGVVTGGPDLFTAFQRLEMLELCAQTSLRASLLGPSQLLDGNQIQKYQQRTNLLPEFEPGESGERERSLRAEICRLVSRGYDQHIMTSAQGDISARLDESSFLITPHDFDRGHLSADQLVLVRNGCRETGKIPSRAVGLHQRIYADHPAIHSIIAAQTPNAMAYAMTGQRFNNRTIAESYITLKTISTVPFDWQMDAPEKVSAALAGNSPAILIANDTVLTAGQTLLAAFDRLEVAEFSARAQIDSLCIGPLIPLNDEQINQLDQIYFPEMTH